MLLPGLGRVRRGAETAFLALAHEWSKEPGVQVTLFGSGSDVPSGVSAVDVGCVPRERFERWPRLPVLRNEYCYEELSFVLRLLARRLFRPHKFDVALHCTFPFVNWYLRWAARGRRLKSVFVTENGDWMCRADSREYRTFGCDGLVCTNPEYFERHRAAHRAVLIPNGVDPEHFRPRGESDAEFTDPRVPNRAKIVLMVSALISSKRVADGIRAVAQVPDVFLVIAGDGPERGAVAELSARELPGRHLLLGAVPRCDMPELYRRADAFVHMSQDEPSCISYLEAAATGLPLVVHDAPVPRWTLGDAAVYANTSDVRAVAQAIRLALGHDGRELGNAARARMLDGWTWAALAARYRRFFESLLGCSASAEGTCSR